MVTVLNGLKVEIRCMGRLFVCFVCFVSFVSYIS